eukprot:270-Chlamydomonas_euryale.AAC.1
MQALHGMWRTRSHFRQTTPPNAPPGGCRTQAQAFDVESHPCIGTMQGQLMPTSCPAPPTHARPPPSSGLPPRTSLCAAALSTAAGMRHTTSTALQCKMPPLCQPQWEWDVPLRRHCSVKCRLVATPRPPRELQACH